MQDKKGWMRILEAFIAILIILTSIIVLYNKPAVNPDITKDVYDRQTRIMQMMINNDSMREKIIRGSENDIEDIEGYVQRLVPQNWNYSINICKLHEICPGKDMPYDREIFASEALVTSTIDNYDPKKIRFYVWMK